MGFMLSLLGNDMARILRWGKGYSGEDLEPYVTKYAKYVVPLKLDRYHSLPPSLPPSFSSPPHLIVFSWHIVLTPNALATPSKANLGGTSPRSVSFAASPSPPPAVKSTNSVVLTQKSDSESSDNDSSVEIDASEVFYFISCRIFFDGFFFYFRR